MSRMRTWRKKSFNHSFFLIKKECRCSFFIIAWKDWKKILPWNVDVIYSTLVNWKKELQWIEVFLFVNLKIKTFITCSFVKLKKNSTHSHYFKTNSMGNDCSFASLLTCLSNPFLWKHMFITHTSHCLFTTSNFFALFNLFNFQMQKHALLHFI